MVAESNWNQLAKHVMRDFLCEPVSHHVGPYPAERILTADILAMPLESHYVMPKNKGGWRQKFFNYD